MWREQKEYAVKEILKMEIDNKISIRSITKTKSVSVITNVMHKILFACDFTSLTLSLNYINYFM